MQTFATKQDLKIENGKLILDENTQDIEFINLGQFNYTEFGEDNVKEARIDIKITAVEFRTQQNLRYLDLGKQPLKKMTIKNCPNLESLFLFGCELEEIKFEGKFPELKTLDLSKNELSELSLTKENFPKLENLYVNGNPITDISFLSAFILQDDSFDYGIGKCENIQNPLPEVVKQGKVAIRNLFEQQSKYGTENFYEAKIIIVGEPEAGKTTLRRLLSGEKINIPATEEEQPSTHGVSVQKDINFDHPIIQNVKITTNIWDFGGQDIQRNLHHYFLSPDALYIIVSNIRKEDTQFYYWFEAIKFFSSEKTPVIVVKNDYGDAGSNDIDIEQYKRDFPAMAKNITDVRLNLGKIKNENKIDWENLTNYLIPKQLERLNTVGSEGVKIWTDIKEEFLKEKKSYIEFEDLLEIAEKKGMKNETDVKFMLHYFHRVGIIIYYETDDYLSNYVFIKLKWITENIYAALTENNISENGFFNKENLFEYWKQKRIKHKERTILLELMGKEKFDVSYPISDTMYAVPILFPVKIVEYKKLGDDFLQLKYEFPGFLPKGLLSRFIVRMYKYIEHNKNNKDLAWKKGVVLVKNKSRAIVFEHTNAKTISIDVDGADKISFRSVIINTFEELFRRYPNKPNLSIPCNCEKCSVDKKNAEFYTYNEL